MNSVIPSVHGKVLTVLARATSPLGSRQVTELIGGGAGRRRVDAVLAQLAAAGIAEAESYPPSLVYRLNRKHLAASAILSLATLREQMLTRISEAFTQWDPQPEAAWLFGSSARGDGSPSSDIDIIALRPDSVEPDDAAWDGQSARLATEVVDWTGNDCRLLDYSVSEFRGLVVRGERLVKELEKDSIRLYGSPVGDFTQGESDLATRKGRRP